MRGYDVETVELADVRCLRETEKAMLVEVEGEQHWIPKSQILEGSDIDADAGEAGGILIVSAWFAKARGLA